MTMQKTLMFAEQALTRRLEALRRGAAPASEQELNEVEHALRRLSLGSFGTCERCAGPIGLQRLRAIPETRCCLSCSNE